jgi:hypothetical protein
MNVQTLYLLPQGPNDRSRRESKNLRGLPLQRNYHTERDPHYTQFYIYSQFK